VHDLTRGVLEVFCEAREHRADFEDGLAVLAYAPFECLPTTADLLELERIARALFSAVSYKGAVTHARASRAHDYTARARARRGDVDYRAHERVRQAWCGRMARADARAARYKGFDRKCEVCGAKLEPPRSGGKVGTRCKQSTGRPCKWRKP
jgi:hypothetical protein